MKKSGHKLYKWFQNGWKFFFSVFFSVFGSLPKRTGVNGKWTNIFFVHSSLFFCWYENRECLLNRHKTCDVKLQLWWAELIGPRKKTSKQNKVFLYHRNEEKKRRKLYANENTHFIGEILKFRMKTKNFVVKWKAKITKKKNERNRTFILTVTLNFDHWGSFTFISIFRFLISIFEIIQHEIFCSF